MAARKMSKEEKVEKNKAIAAAARKRRAAEPVKIQRVAKPAQKSAKKSVKKSVKKLDVDKAAKQAEAKAKATAAKQAKVEAQQATVKTLAPVAKEINVRFEKANGLDSKADDHRIAAAQRLAEAKAKCEETGVNFKSWCEANVTQAYETVRKLVSVGAADDPVAALADMRSGNKKAAQKHRDGKKKASTTGAKAISGPKISPFQAADQAFSKLDEKSARNLLESRAAKVGLEVVAPGKKGNNTKSGVFHLGMETMKSGFDGFSPSEKMSFLEWCAEKVGATVKMDL